MDFHSDRPKYEHRRGILARQRILDALAKRTTPPTLSELAADVGQHYATVRAHRRLMAWHGDVELSTRRRNHPTRVRITPPCKQ